MGRGPLLTVGIAVVIGVAAIATATAAPSAEPLCGAAAGKTLASDPKARVYSVEISGTESTFGCSPAGPHPWKLGPFGQRDGGAHFWGPPLIAGPWAGGVYKSRRGVDTYSFMVRSRNLRTGEEIRCDAGAGVAPRRGERIYDVVLSEHGSLAWTGESWMPIYEPPAEPGPGAAAPMPLPRKHVLKCNESGSVVIERGEEIAVKSLKLTGQTLSWTNAGEEKTARLP